MYTYTCMYMYTLGGTRACLGSFLYFLFFFFSFFISFFFLNKFVIYQEWCFLSLHEFPYLLFAILETIHLPRFRSRSSKEQHTYRQRQPKQEALPPKAGSAAALMPKPRSKPRSPANSPAKPPKAKRAKALPRQSLMGIF